MKHLDWIAQDLSLKGSGLKNCVQLLKDGNSLAFIARYRKEATGGLNEEIIAAIEERLAYFDKLSDRKESILKSLKDNGHYTTERAQQLEEIRSLVELEDFYLPFKPKRTTKADLALEHGLGSLAALVMKQEDQAFTNRASSFKRGPFQDSESVSEGALDIAAQWINENQYLRKRLRQLFQRASLLSCKLKDPDHEKADHYRDYHSYADPLAKIPSHRMLAILRAESEGVLTLKIAPVKETALELIESVLSRGQGVSSPWLKKAYRKAYQKNLAPSFSLELKNEAREKAEDTAIKVFANNLRQLLSAPPLHAKRVLAIDPGFKSGCKLVCLNEQGALLHNENIYPHPPQNDRKQALRKLAQLVEAYKIDAIAIGNGTAGRETEYLVERAQFKRKVQIFSVSEAGASVYSASSVARAEFPNYDVTVRGAVSIGRRLQDPLAELVKIDPKAIGVGQYQHDLNPKKLEVELEKTVVSVVNEIGVELNQASAHLLRFISGLGPKLAQSIIDHRKEHGSFRSRAELLEVNGLGAKAFEQSAGFLRINKATELLDSTAVHPESYDLVKALARQVKVGIDQLISDKALLENLEFPLALIESEGKLQMESIREELLKAGRDQRGTMRAFSFDSSIRKMEDLKVGMILPGLVNNLTKFGAFVDLGIKQTGLVHISEIADRFISDPAEELNLQQAVKVKVIAVDLERARIQLSIKQVKNEKGS